MALAQSGDRRALDRLLRDFQAPLYRHACTLVGDPDLALDALQASLLIMARRLKSLRDPRWFRAWAYRITTRESVHLACRRGRDRQLFDDGIEVETLDQPESEEGAGGPPPLWIERLAELPPGAQVVLRLHFLEEMRLSEIAEALEVPLGTVKSRLAYGLTRLRTLAAADQATGTNG
ncbi:MAG TPA: RNA polymerase sigma factor [Allosphingosinicella sp.]